MYVREPFIRHMGNHEAAVASIAAAVRRFYERREPFRVYHRSTYSTRPSERQLGKMVDTSELDGILEVNAQSKTILVEPNVPMDKLVDSTLPYGLIPPVVMEFPGITVGGGFAGTAGESSSFRHGIFEKIVLSIEIVLANGEVVTASREQNTDLFHGASSSLGTLGIVTALKVKLVGAKRYVELTYHPTGGVCGTLEKLKDLTKDDSIDYIDGILFSSDRGIICSGRLMDEASATVQRFTRAKDPWFYQHAERFDFTPQDAVFVESVPLEDYLFRYDRGAFWTGKYSFRYFMVPFNRITRWILDYFMHARVMYRALHQSGHSNRYVLQDVAVPFAGAEELVKHIGETIGCYPLWLCPISWGGELLQSNFGLFPNSDGNTNVGESIVSFGVWGPGPRERQAFVKINRDFEQKIQEVGGRKWLYAVTYYTEDEFWNIYNRNDYEALRAKYHATYLPSIYEKVRLSLNPEHNMVSGPWKARLKGAFWRIWPLSGLYGVCKAVIGGEHLLHRRHRRK